MSRFWSELTHRLSPYTPGEQPRMPNLVKLNTNEHPLGPSPRALEAIRAEAADSLRLYPDPQATALRETMAAYHRVTPDQVCFEVTENSVITNIEHAQRFIGVLHGMGCHFALDDFGRGLSSFGNLKNLALDYLKIDGTFIRNLAVDSVNQAMVAAMIKLARTLNFQVIAEPVEDAGALDAAKKMGVDFLQGFYLGRPQPLARVVPTRSIS